MPLCCACCLHADAVWMPVAVLACASHCQLQRCLCTGWCVGWILSLCAARGRQHIWSGMSACLVCNGHCTAGSACFYSAGWQLPAVRWPLGVLLFGPAQRCFVCANWQLAACVYSVRLRQSFPVTCYVSCDYTGGEATGARHCSAGSTVPEESGTCAEGACRAEPASRTNCWICHN